MRVLLAEDGVMAQKTSLFLRSYGFTVDHIDTGREALEMARLYDYDLILLELMLPDMDGYEVIRCMRAAHLSAPVIVLSTLSRPQAKVRAFTVGADDFVTRPFDQAELTARMHAVLRRSRGYSGSTLQVGPLQLNLDSREVSVDGRPLYLTKKEYAILQLLVLRKGSVVSKDAFLSHLYGGMDEPAMKIIDVFVCKLRKKLQVAGAGHLLSTLWGRGFMLGDKESRPPVSSGIAPTLGIIPIAAALDLPMPLSA